MTSDLRDSLGLRRAQHMAWRSLGDETVLLDLQGKRIYALNSTASVIWHALDGVKTPQDLRRLAGLAESSSNAEQTESFLAELDRCGLAEWSSAHDPTPAIPPFPTPADAAVDPPPPRITWQEGIQAFAQAFSCAFSPAGGPPCTGAPHS